MVGLGAGSVTNFLIEWFPDLKIDVVEIDEKVIEVSKKYFFLQESNRYRIFQEDGRVFIKNRKGQEAYDWIILDAFKSGSIPYHLKTHEFYKEIRSILKPNWVVVSNLYGKGNALNPAIPKLFCLFSQIFIALRMRSVLRQCS